MKMHGRVKVKTTAEQQAEKAKEKQQKLLLYNAAVHKAYAKREVGELDEEALEATQLLLANPDFYTIWNLRKEIISNWKLTKPVEELNSIMDKEIDFTESCLRVNPKSYGSWYHRFWILNEMPEPNWTKELQLCNRYLELDERNFHCWDYRFLIAKYCKVSPEEEIRFSDLKISSNFSNYSSWHYRSKLLPSIYPDPDKQRAIEEVKLMKEFELVQNAAFTDPEDPSVWFYHQWLLGHDAKQCLPISFYYDRQHFVVVFTRAISLVDVAKSISVIVNDIEENLDWRSSFQESSVLWISKLSNCEGHLDINLKYRITDDIITESMMVMNDGENEKSASFTNHTNQFNKIPLTDVTVSVLKQELKSINQLLELEPDSKWPLLTAVTIMRCLNFIEYKLNIFEHLNKLKQVDPFRTGFYDDLRSKYVLENLCENLTEAPSVLDLTNLEITKLYHCEYYFTAKTINLSKNALRSLHGVALYFCVQELIADENEISSFEGVEGLLHLQHLSLQSNKITDLEALQPLEKCIKLTHLNVKNNDVCQSPEFNNYVRTLLPNLKQLNGNVL